jgi:hypothetical protein
MNSNGKIELLEQCHTVAIGDVTLNIIAHFAGENEWELCIENEHGIKSIWTELFRSSGSAIAAGLRAIENEGAEEFSGIEGFEYLAEK